MAILIEKLTGQVFNFSDATLGDIVSANTTSLNNRVTNLENNEIKIIYSENIEISASTTGNIIFPSGSTIDETILGEDGNCVLWTIDGNGNYIEEVPQDSNGQAINSTIDNNGDWVVSNTTNDNALLVFILKLDLKDYPNLDSTKIIQYVEQNEIVVTGITSGSTDNQLPTAKAVYDEIHYDTSYIISANTTLTKEQKIIYLDSSPLTITMNQSPLDCQKVTIINRGGGTNIISGGTNNIETTNTDTINDNDTINLLYITPKNRWVIT